VRLPKQLGVEKVIDSRKPTYLQRLLNRAPAACDAYFRHFGGDHLGCALASAKTRRFALWRDDICPDQDGEWTFDLLMGIEKSAFFFKVSLFPDHSVAERNHREDERM